jgi:hypothetical protein
VSVDRGDGIPPLAVPAIASAAAAVLHATAAGIHAEHQGLTRIFIALAVAQAAVAVAGFVWRRRAVAAALVAVNAAALAGWVVTRLIGISWIGGLEVAERAQLADSICALFAAIAVLGTIAVTVSASSVPSRSVLGSAVLAGVLLVPGLTNATTHDHAGHADSTEHAADHGGDHESGTDAGPAHLHDDDDGAVEGGEAAAAADEHPHEASTEPDHHATETEAAEAVEAGSTWPRPWDPTEPIDFSGVEGVTAEQQRRAEQLVSATLRDLPAFADVDTVGALGYRSIGDADTGFEHYINYSMIVDDKFLDPTAPESLVYEVDGDTRTLVSAMFIAADTPIDDPQLVDFGGALMQWHVHQNLCWGLDENGQPKVKAVLTSPTDTCPPQTVNAGGENPMVHVWIAPHECGPFAALEGHGAGQVDPANGQRVDQCGHAHGHGDDHSDADADGDVVAAAYDPTMPIDLGGVEGVTPQQQAFAENLVAATVRDLPQWSDLEVVEAAGFRSIGDAATGHEHYLQWDWIDDDVWLDPDRPESLVFEPQPDGTKKLVSAMFMLPSEIDLEEVPDWGGALMQWHVHGDLCFTADHDAPQVATLKPVGGTCPAPLVDFPLSPMIHVWITPTRCGPFAALEGVAGGQVPEGEQVMCDHAHGTG